MSTVSSLVASKLLSIKAIKLNVTEPFTWASGIKSPIYCDNRLILSYPQIRDYIKDQFKSKLWAFGDPEVIAGVATAGIPHGALLADCTNKPFIYVRSSSKAHGRKNMIEGELKPGSRVLVIEDLISTGKSSLAACEALQEAGAEIIGVLAIFTYGLEIAKDNFKSKGIPMDTLTNYRALLVAANEANYITESDKRILENWNESPKAWSENYLKNI